MSGPKAENTDPRTNYAVKYGTARGHLTSQPFSVLNTEDPRVGVRDIPAPGSLMYQKYPAQKLHLQAVFFEARESENVSRVPKFLPAILGPEIAAPILWASGKIAFFLHGNPHAHKIPRFRGGGGIGIFFGGGGGKCRFYFYGREDFSERSRVSSKWEFGVAML